MLPDLEAELYAIPQNSREPVDDYIYRLYAIYEKVTQQQLMQNLQVMAEATEGRPFYV